MKLFSRILMAALLPMFAISCSNYEYETVENDPTGTRIYTLDNGLKVYMSVIKDEPRIDAHIAVKVGGKNDPSETTGLAHYFEHLMFKGTEQFGTTDYAAEKPLLDEIEAQFEIYRKTTDEEQRKAIYHVIDSLSYEASKIAIPNEYDKLMAAIGASGTNAYTGMDMTVYTENIPSNQIENWAMIQADRFKHSVIRGFHTELETVYEEKNMSLTQDIRKVYEVMFSSLIKNHPYGTQTVLGTQQHLKNPSITNIKNYYHEWYVPNNIAICMSGDFDPDQAIKVIDKYFGDWEPNNNLKKMEFAPEEEITEPIRKEVFGLESPFTLLAWRLPAINDPDYEKLALLSQVMNNGLTGLIDLNVNQLQKVHGAYSGIYEQADYCVYLMQGQPKQGQTLEQVNEILLAEIDNLKKGNFDEALLHAIVNNYKLYVTEAMESSAQRTNFFVDCFLNDFPWSRRVAFIDNISKITKEDIVAYANKYFTDGYVAINKIQKKDDSELKIAKPAITPIVTNRDAVSDFLQNVQNSKVTPIEPVFVDFEKDMSKLNAKSNIPVLYTQNKVTDYFELRYRFDFGRYSNLLLPLAFNYSDYIGTSTMTPEDVKQAFYALACQVYFHCSDNVATINISGLGENMKEAIKLLENIIADAQPNPEALKNLKADILKSRENNKHSQRYCANMLNTYAEYGSKYAPETTISAKALAAVKDSELIDILKSLTSKAHEILYYGPMSGDELISTINELHNVPETLVAVDKADKFKSLEVKENSILIAPYDAKQIYFAGYSNRGEKYDPQIAPILALYNEYFGGGMNAIVFQEMREARGLAYSARARMYTPSKVDETYVYSSFIATQNDKMIDAMAAFDEIINDMPQSEAAFDIAKEALITNIRTNRVIKDGILYRYIAMRDLGLDYDINKLIFEKAQNYTLEDIVKFQQEWVKDRTYTYTILGDAKDLDLEGLKKYGPITHLTLTDIFGY